MLGLKTIRIGTPFFKWGVLGQLSPKKCFPMSVPTKKCFPLDALHSMVLQIHFHMVSWTFGVEFNCIVCLTSRSVTMVHAPKGQDAHRMSLALWSWTVNFNRWALALIQSSICQMSQFVQWDEQCISQHLTVTSDLKLHQTDLVI